MATKEVATKPKTVTPAPVVAVASVRNHTPSAKTVQPVTTATSNKGTIYKAGTQAVAGIKQAGSLNANGVLAVAPGRNTPRS